MKSNLTYRISKKCKICKINQVKPALFEKIHELRFKDGYTLEELVKYINTDLNTKKYNLMNFSSHFKSHIPIELKAKYEMQVQTKETALKAEERTVTDELRQKAEKLVAGKVDLYKNLEEIYKTLEIRFRVFDEMQGKIMHGFNIDGYTAITKELRACLVELNKMKQSQALIKIAIDSVMKNYTIGALQGIHKELELLRNTLKYYIKDNAVVSTMLDNIKENVGTHFSESSKSALKTVKEYLN